MRYHGIIFDMDGTITAPYLDFARMKARTGVDGDLIDHLRGATGEEYERLHALLMEFEADGAANSQLNVGAREVLDQLAERGLPTALLTRNSRKSVEDVCARLQLKFDVTVTREDAPRKPAPEPVWEIARRWNAPASAVLVVGDYKWDLLCAHNAGAPCALLIDGGEVPDWGRDADFVIRRLEELIPIIDGER